MVAAIIQPAPLAQVQSINPKVIAESPSNPRRRYGPLDELVESVKQKGILQPLLVRPRAGDTYELVFGHRRLRAAKAAGLAEVPAMVREIQLVENCQREDVHGMEEAEAYERLIAEHHLTEEEVARRVGKTTLHVKGRLRLCGLVKGAREAFLKDRFSLDVALMLTRVPRSCQAKAALEVANGRGRGEPMTTREAGEYLRSHYMRLLNQAPFDLKDVTLVPEAGVCADCPKRSGNQKGLFNDVPQADTCTDPDCYGRKAEAAWARLQAKAEERGERVLSAEETEKVLPHGQLAHGAAYVAPDAMCWDDPKRRTWGQLLGKKAPALAYARDSEGKVHTLFERTTAVEALKERGYAFAQEPRKDPGAGLRAEERKRREVAASKREAGRAAMGELMEKVAKAQAKADPTLARVLVGALLKGGWGEVLDEVVKRRGVRVPSQFPEKTLAKVAAGLSGGELAALALELAITRGAYPRPYLPSYGEAFLAACKAYGVDVKKHEAQAKAVAREKR